MAKYFENSSKSIFEIGSSKEDSEKLADLKVCKLFLNRQLMVDPESKKGFEEVMTFYEENDCRHKKVTNQ